jgi:pimeloyl-ACP methyl ester carboxylesterase
MQNKKDYLILFKVKKLDEKIFFNNSHGEKLVGIMSHFSESNEIVIIVHGYASSKNGANNKWIFGALNEAKINSFRIDLSGCGESEGKFEDQTITKTIDDVKSAIKCMQEKGFDKIDLLGESSGGMSVIGASLKNKNINKLILIAPSMDFVYQRVKKFGQDAIDRWKDNGHIIYTKCDGTKLKINYSFFEDAKNNIVVKKANQLSMPVLLIYGSDDQTIPADNCRKFAQGLKNSKVIELNGAEHVLMKNNFHLEVMELVVEWLK